MPTRHREQRRGCIGAHAIVVLNLPVPDDRRVWQQACALRDSGRAVEVLCPAMRGHRPGRRTVDGVTVTYLRTFEGVGAVGLAVEGLWNTLQCMARLPGLVRRRTSSLQVCNPPDTLFPLLLLCRLLGIGTVYDQHDVVPAMASVRGHLRVVRPIFEWFERLTVWASDVVITASETQRLRLHARYGCDAVLVRSATIAEDPPDYEAGQGCHLGYLGVVGSQEGLEELLEATTIARDSGLSSLTVTVAGDGPFLDEVRSLAQRLGLDDVVTFPGWLQGGELERFLESIDAMVVTDPDSEYNHYCSMNKVLEAMSRSMPVLMRPLRENAILTGTHPWIASDWSAQAFADLIEDFASAPPDVRADVGARLRRRFDDQVDWRSMSRTYVGAISDCTTADA